MKPLLYCIIGFLGIALTYSCKKTEESAPVATTAFNFSYTGNAFIYDTLSFKSNLPAGTSLKWEFGDGYTSTLESPIHLFGANKTYTVKLTANGKTVSKDIAVSLGLSRLAKINTWASAFSKLNPDPHTNPSLAVVNFTLIIPDDSSIIIPQPVPVTVSVPSKYSGSSHLLCTGDNTTLDWDIKNFTVVIQRIDTINGTRIEYWYNH